RCSRNSWRPASRCCKCSGKDCRSRSRRNNTSDTPTHLPRDAGRGTPPPPRPHEPTARDGNPLPCRRPENPPTTLSHASRAALLLVNDDAAARGSPARRRTPDAARHQRIAMTRLLTPSRLVRGGLLALALVLAPLTMTRAAETRPDCVFLTVGVNKVEGQVPL